MSARLTVLHVVPYLAPAWAHGSVPEVVWAMAAAQATNGWDVTVLTTDAMAPHERLPAGAFLVEGVRVVRVRNVSGLVGSWLQLSTPLGLRRRARALVDERPPGVVHLHELRTVENCLVHTLLPREAKVVLSTHGRERAPNTARSATLLERLLVPLLHRIDRVVVESEAEASSVRALWSRRGVPLGAATVVLAPNGDQSPRFLAERVYPRHA